MSDPYRELSAVESVRADALIAEAQDRGARALTRSTLTAARVAIASAQKSNRDDRAVANALRGNSMLRADIARDVAAAERDALTLLSAAMLDGYEMDLRGRSQALAEVSRGIRFRVEITDQDRQDLAGWPIQGHLAKDACAYLANVLRYAVDGAIIQSAVSAPASAASAPDLLADCARLHGMRLGSLVSEGFYAGIQKATKDLRLATA